MRAAQLAAPRRDAVVAELMSQPVLTVEVTETLWDAWQLLFVSGLRHLVVLNEDGSSLGVLSDRNILAEVTRDGGFPPVMLTRPSGLMCSEWWRDRSAVRPDAPAFTSGRRPAHTPVMSAAVTPVLTLAFKARNT